MVADSQITVVENSIFRVRMGGPETTDEIMAKLGLPFDPWITQKNCPVTPSKTPWEDGIQIIYPGIDSESSLRAMEGFKYLQDANLHQPTHEHAIRFAQQYGSETLADKEVFVMFLHEPLATDTRGPCTVYLSRRPKWQGVGLSTVNGWFSDCCGLAGVRPAK